MIDSTHFGEYGGKVLRTFKGGGKQWKSGEPLTPEDVEEWPLQNRIALSNVGKIKWYGEPAETPTNKKAAKKPKSTKSKSRKRVRKQKEV